MEKFAFLAWIFWWGGEGKNIDNAILNWITLFNAPSLRQSLHIISVKHWDMHEADPLWISVAGWPQNLCFSSLSLGQAQAAVLSPFICYFVLHHFPDFLPYYWYCWLFLFNIFSFWVGFLLLVGFFFFFYFKLLVMGATFQELTSRKVLSLSL